MDTKTLTKVVDMLDNILASTRDEDVKLYYSFSDEENRMLGRRKALEDFKEHLNKYIDKQVAHMETEQGM
jgi:hypothetical protein